MFAAILALLLLPVMDVSKSRGMQFRPLSKTAFFIFVANFLVLMQLGAKHVESPFIEFGQISTVLYFLYFTFVIYCLTIIENTLIELKVKSSIHHMHASSFGLGSFLNERMVECK
jgi:ubiquinol-cytochrome c reductase cytochrome b subunit